MCMDFGNIAPVGVRAYVNINRKNDIQNPGARFILMLEASFNSWCSFLSLQFALSMMYDVCNLYVNSDLVSRKDILFYRPTVYFR
jgi:hypothetical protein